MNALLLSAVLAAVAAQPGGREITNASSLVDRDWASVFTQTEKVSQYRTSVRKTNVVFSLRPDEGEIDRGKAWILHIPESGPLRAWKGYFSVFIDGNDEDNLILSFRMTRKYNGSSSDSGIKWNLDSDWEPVGVHTDLPIADDTVPERLSITMRRAFYVDAAGNKTRRYYDSSLLDRIRYGREEDIPYDIEFLAEGVTYPFTSVNWDEYLKKYVTTLPGYSPRKR